MALDAWLIRMLSWITHGNGEELQRDWVLAVASRASGPWSSLGLAMINYFAGCYLVFYAGMLVAALVLTQPSDPALMKALLGAVPATFGARALLYGVWFRMDVSRRPDRNRVALVAAATAALLVGEVLTFQVR